MPILNNWRCVSRTTNPYQAPELGRLAIQGTLAEDHNSRTVGTRIVTSIVIETNGRDVTTETGTVYTLGIPDVEYLVFLEEKGIPYDQANPVK